jgi:hypothetical protein
MFNKHTSTVLAILQWCLLLSGVASSSSLRGSPEQAETVFDRDLQTSAVTFKLINAVTNLAITTITPNARSNQLKYRSGSSRNQAGLG